MARPSMKADNLKRHATKKELESRKAAEQAALTGIPIRETVEVKASNTAHGEFCRVLELLTAAGKNDALYEAVINEYCLYKADIMRYLELRAQIEEDEQLTGEKRYKLILKVDKQIEAYRAKRFAIERENGFTIASALRAIPKKPVEQRDPLLEALRGG